MKRFMERYSYESVHMFLNQVAIGLFGVSLALASGMAKSEPLRIVTGVFSVLFFLFLQYNLMWKVGANDRLADDLGKSRINYSVPILMWLLSNSVNFVLAILTALGNWLPDTAFGSIGGVAVAIKLVIEGMYTGLLAIDVGGAPLNTYWFMHFLTPLPALVVVFLAYYLGTKNVKVFGKREK